jgi:hypothetical protein
MLIKTILPTCMAFFSFFEEVLAKALPTIVSAFVIGAAAVWFIAYQRALRMREAIDLLISSWRHYRDDQFASERRFKADTELGLAEIRSELERTDKAVLRPTVKFRRELGIEIDAQKDYIDSITIGTTEEAIDTAGILILRDETDPRTAIFFGSLDRLAALRDTVGWTTYLMGPWS